MKPGELASFDRKAGTFEVKEVDVRQYVLWKDGYFTFENESLEQILNTLSFWYDVDVFFQSESAKQLVFTGYMKRYSDISEILDAITDVVGVNFTINGKTIIVSKYNSERVGAFPLNLNEINRSLLESDVLKV